LGLGLRENKKIVVRMNESARQTHVFVVRLGKMHGKLVCLPCASEKHTAKFFLKKPIFHLFGMWRREKYFAVRRGENARQTKSLSCIFFGCTTKNLFAVHFFFAVRPIKNAQQKLFVVGSKKMHGKNFNAWQTRFSHSVCKL
jgi:hypothetical protein